MSSVGAMRRLTAGVLLGLASVVAGALGAGPALGHASFRPDQVGTGGPTTVALRVPNEREDAATVAIELVLPEGGWIEGVTAGAADGWTAEVTAAGVTWTATAGGLTGEDDVLLPLTLATVYGEPGQAHVLKVLQTYSDGEVVRWIEAATGGAEPEHPAPVVTVTGPALARPSPSPSPSTTGDSSPATTAAAPVAEGGGSSGGPPIGLLVGIFLVTVVLTALVVVRRDRAAREAE